MSESKDSAIKLFGRTIKLPEIPSESGLDYSARSGTGDDSIVRHRSCSPSYLAEGSDLGGDGAKLDSVKGIREGGGVEVDISNELVDPTGMKENPKAPSHEEQNESSESQDKTLKKPDNLIPCPRCSSLDTKFCYYNNYNVSQPRHFCKNCHRYWTAGGTIRNVAVGAGRRKNKNIASQCRQLTVLETPQNGHEELATNAIHPTLKPNITLLSSCESIASVLKIADKSVHDLKSNGYTPIPPPTAAYCPVGFSMPFFPPAGAAPYVGCSMPGSWSAPWLNPLPASHNYENPNRDHNSPTLGKHSRDDDDDSLMKRANPENDEPLKGNNNNTEKCLWVPKTLRIVDPEEAAKSSLWSTTLGIKDDKVDSANGGGRLKAFQSKGDNKFQIVEASTLLQANPSALSRSLSFQESSWDKSGRS